MDNNVFNSDNLGLLRSLSSRFADILANEVSEYYKKNNRPSQIFITSFSYEIYTGVLATVAQEITDLFNQFNESGRYTKELKKHNFSKIETSFYLTSLIYSAAAALIYEEKQSTN